MEATLLEWGARTVTTVEYGAINSTVPQLLTTTPSQYAQWTLQRRRSGQAPDTFDSLWMFSSLEHDGLGPYSDPINPDGDLQTLVKLSCMLKPGGLLFLAVPAAVRDRLWWNVHRLYGPLRFPLLFRHWHVVQVFKEVADTYDSYQSQPLIVLQNRIGCSNGYST